MSAPSIPRISWIVVGSLLLAAGPVRGQPDEDKKPVADKHVDHEGFPLPAEAIARVGSARFRGDFPICQIAYSLDDKQILCATGDVLEYWDAATGKPLRTIPLKVHWQLPGAVVFQPDGKVLVFETETTCKCLDVQSGKTVWTKQLKPASKLHSANIRSVRFSPKAKSFALFELQENVRVFDLSDGKERWLIDLKIGPTGRSEWGQKIAVTSDEKTVLVSTGQKLIHTLDASTGERKFLIELPEICDHIELSPDGSDLLCRGPWRMLVRDWAGKKEVIKMGQPMYRHHSYGPATVFSPDGRWLAFADEPRSVFLFNTATGKEVFKLAATYTTHLAFSQDSKRFVTDSPVRQWDVATGKPLSASADPLMSIRGFTDNGKHLLINANPYWADRYSIVDWKTGKLVEEFAKVEAEIHSRVAMSLEGGFLAFIQNWKNREILLVEARTGKELRRLSNEATNVEWYQFAGKRLLTGSKDKVIRVWDAAEPKPLLELRELPANGFQCNSSRDGRLLAVTSEPDGVQVWDLTSGKRLMSVATRGSYDFPPRFSHDGRLVVCVAASSFAARPHEVTLIDVATGKEKRVIPMDKLVRGIFTDGPHIDLSANHRTLATIHADPSELRLWEVVSGKERHRFEGHKDGISGIGFSPDGSLLAASSDDAPIFIWDVYGKHAAKPQLPEKWSDDDEKRLINTLAGDDGVAAFQTIRRLIRNPGPAVSLLAKHITPAAPIDAKRVARSIAALDSDDFAERDRAYAELEKNADGIQGIVETALKNKPALETKRRLESLLVKAENATPEYLRQTRALEALEQIATPDAVRLLESLAKGAPAARLTREARESLERIRKR
jgi:WD40 repeat protein